MNALKYIIPILFLAVYASLLYYLIINNPVNVSLFSKIFGTIAFINIFVQVMLGAFRDFFKKIYNPAKVYWFHNYLGLITLVLVFFHLITKNFVLENFISVFMLNNSFAVNLGVVAFYLMALTVITSDLKYFFKINIDYKLWRIIHLINYSLFPLIYFHIFYLGTIFNNSFLFYLVTILLIISLASIIYRASRMIKAKKIII